MSDTLGRVFSTTIGFYSGLTIAEVFLSLTIAADFLLIFGAYVGASTMADSRSADFNLLAFSFSRSDIAFGTAVFGLLADLSSRYFLGNSLPAGSKASPPVDAKDYS